MLLGVAGGCRGLPGVVGCYRELRQLPGVPGLPEAAGEAARDGLATEWVASRVAGGVGREGSLGILWIL